MKRDNPKVAIITRTKDRPNFLKRALRSVSEQTYKDYVHVIVNDGGDVSSLEEIINTLNSEQKAKTVLFHRENPSNAPDTIINESIDRIDSEYFVLHDDDDSWHPEFLSQTTGHLIDNPKVGAVVVRADKIVEVVNGSHIRQKKKTRFMPDLKAVSLYRQCIDNQLTPIATLFRRSAYVKVGKFDDSLPVVGDWEFGIRLLLEYDVDFLDPGFALAHYHHREYKPGSEGNTSFAGNEKHRYYTNLIMNRYLREELKDGRTGVGYIMNNIRYNQSYVSSIVKKILPLGVVEKIKRRVGN